WSTSSQHCLQFISDLRTLRWFEQAGGDLREQLRDVANTLKASCRQGPNLLMHSRLFVSVEQLVWLMRNSALPQGLLPPTRLRQLSVWPSQLRRTCCRLFGLVLTVLDSHAHVLLPCLEIVLA